MNSPTQEAIAYLKNKPAYKRILKAVIDKYKKLGHLGGYIVLDKLTPEEEAILAPLDYSIYQTKACKIKVQHFIAFFCSGRFEGADFLEVLKGCKSEELLSNKVVKENALREKEQFFETLLAGAEHALLKAWLEAAFRDKRYGYQIIHQLYTQQKKSLLSMMKALSKTLTYLQEANDEWLPLPILASKATKDAHYFDLDKPAGKLLLYVLSYKAQTAYPSSLDEMNECLYAAGIVRDEISNMTACYGLLGSYKDRKAPWEGFWELGQPLQLTVANLKEITSISALGNKVYIVENPAVFMQLLQKTVSTLSKPKYALICTSGQLNTSSYIILDKLAASGASMYYNGDFDPEGLQIAAKLKNRYGDKLTLWHYEVKDYLQVKGNVNICERLDKLKKINEPELKAVIEMIQKEQTAGYQELLIEELAQDILS